MFKATGLECIKGYDSLFKDISFTLSPGEIIQIKGSNGSGKTSLLKILTGLSQAATGEVFWNDISIEANEDNFKQNLLYIGHLNGLKDELTAFENLNLARQYLGQTHCLSTHAALEAVGLAGYESILAHQLSAGQKRRVALARLHLTLAPLWILDEPTTAIDVEGVKTFEKTIAHHVQNGGMVILTAHQALNFGQSNTRSLSLG